MLMADKYLVWERPAGVSHPRKALNLNLKCCATHSAACPPRRPFWFLTCDLRLHQGASVWVPDPDAVWASAVILQGYSPGDKHLRLQLSDGKVTVDLKKPSI